MIRSLIACSRQGPCAPPCRLLLSSIRWQRSLTLQSTALCKSGKSNHEAVRRHLPNQRFRIQMTEEERARKKLKIEEAKAEQTPQGLFPKFKFYFKRYWYIAIPVHMVVCSAWFAGLYLTVRSGVDVIAVLNMLHLPDSLIEKVKNTPPSAGYVVVALLLYKIVTPLRYAMSLIGIRVAFVVLRKLGLLRTAREVEYTVRDRYADLNSRRKHAVTNLNNQLKAIKRPGRPPTRHNSNK